jgi:serine-type D-Ala-D-Ala carboxypeptidase (penicillin-binding protein 5/6)
VNETTGSRGPLRAGQLGRMRRARTTAAAAAAALLAVLPLAAPPALARAATGHPVAASRHTAPQRKPSGASAPASSTAADGLIADSTVAGGPAAGGPVVGGPELAGRGIVVHYPAHGARRLPSVPASSYVIADAGTGQVLAAKDPHGHFLPASTLKVLTADALMPVLNSRASVVTSAMAADVTPNKVGLVKGHAYPVADLFQALLLISANDAAIALAQATGSYAKGVAMMNAEARRLQADDTVAVRPNGLNARGQRSSAYDLALFARQALTMPEFMRIEATPAAMFPLHRRHSIELFNQNTMLNTYRGDLGGKIGWTTASETTFIAWARRDGHTLIVTLMHCVPLTEMKYAAKLLNWGFAMDGKVTPVGTLARPLPASATAAPGGTSAAAAAGEAGQLGASRPAASEHGASEHGARGQGAGGHGTTRPGRLIQPAGFATIPVTAGIGALVLAGLVAAGVVVLRRRAGGGSPPGP